MRTDRSWARIIRGIAAVSLALALGFLSRPSMAAAQSKSMTLSQLLVSRNSRVRTSFTCSPSVPTVGAEVQFTDTTTGTPTSWLWNFGDGATSTLQNPTHVFSKSGFFKVSLTAANSAGSRKLSRTLSVLPSSAVASFTYSPETPTAGQTVQFTDTSTGSPTSWLWNFGDGATSTSRNPVHGYGSAASYTVSLTATGNSGARKASRTVTVKTESTLAASFTYGPASPAAGAAVQFTDTSTGTPTSWSWSFGDGGRSTSQNPSHTFTTAGSYTVTLTATNASGSKSASGTVTVTTALAASFTYSPSAPTTGAAVQFTDTSTGTPTSWSWSFGDGGTSTSRNPSHTFTTVASYTVTLTVTNAASSASTSRTVGVTPAATLTASFTYSPSSPAMNQSVQFTDGSTGTPASWSWSFGDGGTSTSQNPAHTFTSTGSYTVTLTATGGSGTDTTSQSVTVSAASTIIPDERKVDWSRAGVWHNGTKGIPTYPVGINAKSSPYNAVGNGVTDDTAALQAAITACPTGYAVYIPEGTYSISSSLSLKSGIAVRGAGTDKTKIIQHGNAHVFRLAGRDSISFTSAVSGYTKGSDTIVVGSASLFQVGDLVRLDEVNDPNLVTAVGSDGTCTWCGRSNGNRAFFEDALVKAINGTSITLNRPLYFTFQSSLSPELGRQSRAPILNAGVEDLYIESASEATEGSGVYMYYAVYCWVKNIESYNTARKHINMYTTCYGCEIRDSYLHDAKSYSGDEGYGISLSGGAHDTLVENNILYHMHAPIVIEAGGAGNVIGYNYVERTEHHDPSWFIYHMGTHGAHPHLNLFEGNVVGKAETDDTWGSGSHNVFLRNRITRQNGATTVSGDLVAVIISAWNYYMTFVGNVIGTPGCEGPVEQTPFVSTYDNPVLWKIGFTGVSTGYPTDSKVAETLIRTGNWEGPTGVVQWDPAISDRNIPNSLYLTSAPSWFGTLAWPPFTPESSSFNAASPNKIPAQVVFENGPKLGAAYATSRGF